MAYTQAQLDALDGAIASGTLSVSYDGKTVTYRSMSELLMARDMVARSVSGVSTGMTIHTPVYRRGV